MLLHDLQPASFRGARFFVPRDSLEEGRRTVDHQWPDSNRRYAEDNGFIPPEFKITAILFGANLPGKVAALRNALNRPGPGTFKHPWVGSVQCAVKGPFKIDREDSDGGVVKFEICFLKDGGPIFPAIAAAIPAVVAGLASALTSSVASQFPTVFGTGAMTAASRTAIGAQVAAVGSAVQSAFGVSQDTRTLIGQSLSLADQPDRIASALGSAVRLPFESDAFTSSQLAQGFRALSETAADVVNEATTFAARIGR